MEWKQPRTIWVPEVQTVSHRTWVPQPSVTHSWKRPALARILWAPLCKSAVCYFLMFKYSWADIVKQIHQHFNICTDWNVVGVCWTFLKENICFGGAEQRHLSLRKLIIKRGPKTKLLLLQRLKWFSGLSVKKNHKVKNFQRKNKNQKNTYTVNIKTTFGSYENKRLIQLWKVCLFIQSPPEALSDIIRTFHQTPPEGGMCRPTAHPINLKWRGLSAKKTCCCPSSDLNH